MLQARQAQSSTSAVPAFPLAINEAAVMGAGQMAINTLTCQGIGGIASVALGAMSAKKNTTSMMSMMNIPLDARAAASLPQGPVEFISEGNTFRIVLKATEISINGLQLLPFGILTALHGNYFLCTVLGSVTDTIYSFVHCVSLSPYFATIPHPGCRVAPLRLGRLPGKRSQEQEVENGSVDYVWCVSCHRHYTWHRRDGQFAALQG